MLLAEAVTFDPGLVVALFVAFLLVCAAALAVVVTGLCAGYRSGRDPARHRASTAWRICLSIDGLALLLSLVTGAPVELSAAIAVVAALSWLAHRVGTASNARHRTTT